MFIAEFSVKPHMREFYHMLQQSRVRISTDFIVGGSALLSQHWFRQFCAAQRLYNASKNSRSSSFSTCTDYSTEVLTDRERDLTQQVAELQGRVAILMDELQTVKLKNVGLERKLNAIYNKEEEERIRKEEAAKEDGWSCISTLFCDLWTWQRFWLVCWKKLEFCCSVSKRDVVRLGQFLKSFASCI